MKAVLIFFIRTYKTVLSPFLPRACIYSPTCSEYAVECLVKYGVFKGTRLAASRILRCHPFAKGGWDPVI